MKPKKDMEGKGEQQNIIGTMPQWIVTIGIFVVLIFRLMGY